MKKQHKLHVKIGDKIKIIAGSQKGLVGIIRSISNHRQPQTYAATYLNNEIQRAYI